MDQCTGVTLLLITEYYLWLMKQIIHFSGDIHKDKNNSRTLKASAAGMTKKKLARRTLQSDEPKTANRNVVNLNDVTPLFRNTHAVALHGRALSDYVWLCQLDVAKGLQLPREYMTVKYAKTFLHHIARAERDRVSSDTGICCLQMMVID